MTVVIDEVNLAAFLYNPAGGIAQFMGNIVAPDVLAQSQQFISRPFPVGALRSQRFPPPGPPYLRTGLLRDTLGISSAQGPTGVEFYISPNAVRRDWNYGLILKERSYRFLPDSFYV